MNNFLKLISALCLLLVLNCSVKGQTALNDIVDYTPEDKAIFEGFLSEMVAKKSFPMDQLIIETAQFFLGTPYVASTLEKEPERLVINLREVDCSTFVENVIALTRTLKDNEPSFERFCIHLQYIRYREGKITNYLDRLHYTSDWLFKNDRKKILKDINKEIGGKPFSFHLYFMSTHPDSYKQLKNNPLLVEGIRSVEERINSRTYYYIPKQEIDSYSASFKSGDIVCFTTAIKGLDISHVGIVYRTKEKLTFIHASTLAKKVIINEESLKSYVMKGKNSTGIMLARPLSLLE